MRLTKHVHACVSLEHEGGCVLVDPGVFTPNANALLMRADVVLVTHDHVDHVDADAVCMAMRERPALEVFGPAEVIDSLTRLGADANRLSRVSDGQRLSAAGLEVAVVGGSHARIHAGIEVPSNNGYLIAGTVYHPGDSYLVPDLRVEVLLVPSGGPWTMVGDAIDFVRAISPSRTIPIHEVTLSETGIRSFATFLGASGLTGVPLTPLAPGDSVEI